MRFPGKRKSRHYFPVKEKQRKSFDYDTPRSGNPYIVGIDQLLVDIEAKVDETFLTDFKLHKGQSKVLSDHEAQELYQALRSRECIIGEFAGGAVGNTLHNYSTLADDSSILLGAIRQNITVGDYAFKYICNTSNHVDLSYLQPIEGMMGRAFCLITPDGERTFGISPAASMDLDPEYIPSHVIAKSSALVLSSFLLRDQESAMYMAINKSIQVANDNHIPVVLGLGASKVVGELRSLLWESIIPKVQILSMNKEEASELTGISDPLIALEALLDHVDLVLLTDGPHGLYLGGWSDKEYLRETEFPLHSKSLNNYNEFEFSRAMFRKDCNKAEKIFSHINPFMGGPGIIQNTNGAGDAALAALLHDITSHAYYKQKVPNGPKQEGEFLTYSSLSQICKYANRASYEVLCQNSPRLVKGLPEREDSLENSYWEL